MKRIFTPLLTSGRRSLSGLLVVASALASSSASAQNTQGLVGHYVVLGATQVARSYTTSSSTLTVTPTVSFTGATWSQSLEAANTVPKAFGSHLTGQAQQQVSYQIRVLWVPEPGNPAGLVPQGQDAFWTGEAHTFAQLLGVVPQPPQYFGTFMAENYWDPSASTINTVLNGSHTSESKDGQFFDAVDGGFQFSSQPEGWVGTGTFTMLNQVSWNTSCPSTEKAWGSAKAWFSKRLSTIGGLPVQ